jgi:hypothetical protein
MALTRRRWVIVSTVGLGLLIAALIAAAGRVPFASDQLREKAARTVADRLDAEVDLKEMTVRIFPRMRFKGTGLKIRHKGRRDVPPLISVDAFSIDADLLALWRKRVNRVTLEGLDIQIPPRARNDNDNSSRSPDPATDRHEATAPAPGEGRSDAVETAARDIVIDEVVADEAKLTIIPREPEKRPKVWQMHKLRIRNAGVGQQMPFQTVLTNAVPPGRIDTAGSVGPWNAAEPGLSPLGGRFTFDRADLSVFKGISGILSARGTYGGVLGRIDVQGETETPDFVVKVGGHPVPLHATYHAIVNGTDGDTALERIDATFLKTSLVAKGGVFDVKGADGRIVTLDVAMDDGRLEDIMRLVVNTRQSPMTGALHLETKFDLPPGDRDVVDRLLLNGRFAIRRGRFTNPDVQKKIVELSRRASTKDPAPENVASDFTGRFTLGHGTLNLPTVTFDVPGAAVKLAGEYALRAETLAFAGDLYMDARISETTTGWKSLLLKMVDPLFRRQGRTVVPIKIGGTRTQPSFGIDMGRVLKRDDPENKPGNPGDKTGNPENKRQPSEKNNAASGGAAH